MAADANDPDRGKYIGVACIPVLGPWVMLGFKGSAQYPFGGSDPSVARAGAVTMGLLQAAGLGMTIVGFTVRHEVRVPAVSARLSLVPTVGGAAAVGTF